MLELRVRDENELLLELLDREGPALHALLYRLTLSTHAAEDLMQELFLKLAAHAGWRGARNRAAYARTTALHLGLDWRRGHRRRAAAGEAGERVDPRPLPEQGVERREEWARVLDAAAGLTGQMREAFVLHFLQGEAFEAIAAEMGKTPHQVRALCHKAVGRLRWELGVCTEEGSHAAE